MRRRKIKSTQMRWFRQENQSFYPKVPGNHAAVGDVTRKAAVGKEQCRRLHWRSPANIAAEHSTVILVRRRISIIAVL